MESVRDVYGIGSKKANDLRTCYNIQTVQSLRAYVRKMPDILTDTQREGLKYHNRTKKRMSYDEAGKHAAFIKRHVPGATIAGSYRRKLKTIGDIDVLITTDIKKVVAALYSKKYILVTLAMGDNKFSGIARLPRTQSYRRIDIIKTTKKEKPFALLYFTGGATQNISMRQKAKKMGMVLSQHGLYSVKTKKPMGPIKNERDIFNMLGIDYKAPHDRHT